jgi:hypothetical protein
MPIGAWRRSKLNVRAVADGWPAQAIGCSVAFDPGATLRLSFHFEPSVPVLSSFVFLLSCPAFFFLTSPLHFVRTSLSFRTPLQQSLQAHIASTSTSPQFARVHPSIHQFINHDHPVAQATNNYTRLSLKRTTVTIGGSQALYSLILAIQKEQAKKQLMLLDHLTDAAHYTMATSDTFMPSPTEMVDTNAPNQYFASSHYNEQHVNTNVPLPSLAANPFAPTPNASIPTTPGSVAGRKRSRGDEDDIEFDGSLPTPASESGNVSSYPMSTEAQSGIWADEQMARPFAVDQLRRPSMTSRKSQRMDASVAGADNLAQLVLPANMREATTEPLVDEVTRKLGISWTRMDATEARQINQAAYAKFIANHYPSLKDVKVWFENAALPGYLVQAANVYSGATEFYLFSNDLTEARLVTRDAEQLIPRLQMLPALHLAAPGGQIKAEMSPVMVAQNEVSGYVKKEENGDSLPVHREPEGICAAHSMELD